MQLKCARCESATHSFKMKFLIFLNIFVVLNASVAYSSSIGTKADCAIAVNTDLGEPQPLILIPDAEPGQEWVYPSSGDVISVAQGAKVLLACPQNSVLIGAENLGVETVEATCEGGLQFTVGTTADVSFPLVTCVSYPFHDGQYTGKDCEDGNKEIEIGFKMGADFLRTFTTCFDPVEQNSVWSRNALTNAIGGYQTNFPEGIFVQGSFYDVGASLYNLYSPITQRGTINGLLGLPLDSEKWIDKGDNFLIRGHLSGKTDFVFGAQMRSAYWLVNVAPQWLTVNEGNLRTLEKATKSLAESRTSGLTVYTGTYGIATLPHETTEEEIPLYIFANGTRRGVPVPEVLWKVVYDPDTKEAAAFVISNNIYVDSITPYCTDICDEIYWLNWTATDVAKGLSYCCEVSDLKDTITFIPDLDISGIFKNGSQKTIGSLLIQALLLVLVRAWM